MSGFFNFNGLNTLANSYFSNKTNDSDSNGRRARLRPKPAAMNQIVGAGGNILAPILNTNGMIWPYQPAITYQQDVEYTQVPMVHTNQDFYAYAKTPSVKLTCEGEFTVQNQTEGLYALACIHFLRTVTKMYFGQSANPGTPPPILLFDAYGQYMFNKLPVIITNFQANMPKEPDYVPIDLSLLGQNPQLDRQGLTNVFTTSSSGMLNSSAGSGYVWLPAIFNISVAMTVQNTPSVLTTFNLDSFRNGSLLTGGGWI